jgi:hypothetical protein
MNAAYDEVSGGRRSVAGVAQIGQAISVGNIARRYDPLSVEGLQTDVQSASVAGRMRVKGDISVTRFSHVEYFLLVLV